MEIIMNLDPWKLLWIWIRQNYADPLDPDLQHWFKLRFMSS